MAKARTRTNNWQISNGIIKIKVCNLSAFFRTIFNEDEWLNKYQTTIYNIRKSEDRKATLDNGLTVESKLFDDEALNGVAEMLNLKPVKKTTKNVPLKKPLKNMPLSDRLKDRSCFN